MKIEPVDQPGKYRTGKLNSRIHPEDIEKILGFPANIDDDPDKVKYSWGFLADGHQCGIWDYKDSRWSTYGPQTVFDQLFAHIPESLI